MSKRSIPRIDYKVLNSTGERRDPLTKDRENDSVVHDTEACDISYHFDQLSLNEMPSELELDTVLIIEEIKDVIDENPIDPGFATDLDSNVSRLEDLRSNLRRKSILYEASKPHDEKISASIISTLSTVKEYIKSAKDCKHKTALNGSASAAAQRSMMFTISDIQYHMSELTKEFCRNLDAASNAELIQLKKDSAYRSEQVSRIAARYESILQTPMMNADVLIGIKDIGER